MTSRIACGMELSGERPILASCSRFKDDFAVDFGALIVQISPRLVLERLILEIYKFVVFEWTVIYRTVIRAVTSDNDRLTLFGKVLILPCVFIGYF